MNQPVTKRVLYIVPSWFTLNFHLRGQLSFLKAKGFEVEVAGEEDERAYEAARREGVAYYPVRINTDSAISVYQDLRALCKLVMLMRRRKYQIINCCTKKGSLIASLAAKLSGVEIIVYVVRGLEKSKTSLLKQRLFVWVEKAICLLATRAVMISRSNLAYFREKRICTDGKILLLGEGSSGGIDTDTFKRSEKIIEEGRKFRERHNIAKEAYVLGFVGRLVREKGIREIIQVWNLLNEKYEELHLLFVTPPEIGVDLLNDLNQLKKSPRVHFTGFMPSPVSAYAAMNCLLFPSYGEGFGKVLLEAGAMELPVIATKVKGCVDAVVDRETGLLIDPRDPGALARGIEELVCNKAIGCEMGRKGRRRCLESFRREIIWQAYADLYMELLDIKGMVWERHS